MFARERQESIAKLIQEKESVTVVELSELYDISEVTIRKDLEELYELEKQAAACVSEDAVLMLCLDALRYRDLSEQDMPKLKKLLDETAYCFNRAYSFSTSTFESLVPAYSENGDLRTGYYEKNAVDREDCRFIKTAQAQKQSMYSHSVGSKKNGLFYPHYTTPPTVLPGFIDEGDLVSILEITE